MKKIILLLALILIIPSILALDYNVQVDSPTNVEKYEGEIIENLFYATIKNNAPICDITCEYTTSMNTVGTGIKVSHDGGLNRFPFDLKAQGNEGIASYTLTITCKRILEGLCLLESPETKPPFGDKFTYLYNGDNICTTSNEDCYSASNDCVCGTGKKCKEDLTRTQDEMGCTTYCGNNKVESQYETCSNCPSDVGKCNGMNCLFGNECEGNYCVHEICWNKPWREGDNFCDMEEGENCKNSDDCACKKDELCSNGICEKTKSDEDEINQAVKKGVQDTLETSENKQKTISYVAIGLIISVILCYILFKIIKGNKSKIKSIKKTFKKINKKTKKVIKKTSKKKK